MGFDLIPDPTANILIPDDPPTGLPSSLPVLSRSVATNSSNSPSSEFPDLPRAAHRLKKDQEDQDDWDMVDEEYGHESSAWVGIESAASGGEGRETPEGEDDELIFLDEESLIAMRENEVQKGMKGVGANARGYAQVLRGAA